MKRIGVFSSSCDPLTFGHIYIISQGIKLFDELYIAVGSNVNKEHIFDWDFRLEMVKDCIKVPNVKIDKLLGTIVEFAKNIISNESNANIILLRGVRDSKDISYEAELCRQIREVDDELQSVFIIPPPEYLEISSTRIREASFQQQWHYVEQRVPSDILKILKGHYGRR